MEAPPEDQADHLVESFSKLVGTIPGERDEAWRVAFFSAAYAFSIAHEDDFLLCIAAIHEAEKISEKVRLVHNPMGGTKH